MPMNFSSIKQTWFANIRGDLLAGIVVALALIPEAIAFSIIAGVDPKVGLYASFSICVIIAFAGGRPGMISAATGAMALVMVSRAHFWDITAVSALDKAVLKFHREGTEVEVIGMNEASATLVDRFALHDKPGAVEQLMH